MARHMYLNLILNAMKHSAQTWTGHQEVQEVWAWSSPMPASSGEQEKKNKGDPCLSSCQHIPGCSMLPICPWSNMIVILLADVHFLYQPRFLQLALSYNTSTHSSSAFTPFYVVRAWEVRVRTYRFLVHKSWCHSPAVYSSPLHHWLSLAYHRATAFRAKILASTVTLQVTFVVHTWFSNTGWQKDNT